MYSKLRKMTTSAGPAGGVAQAVPPDLLAGCAFVAFHSFTDNNSCGNDDLQLCELLLYFKMFV